ncbi:MAG TPA: ATP-binding protein [Novosphingobium sp.]|nr:ATP-binding protein [Novosphingobium sp.]
MSIPGVSQAQIEAVLREHLTPSAHITTPERLFGRQKMLTQIQRAFNSEGRHVFIFGDRGVGKTSLAMTAAYLSQSSEHTPIYVLCSGQSTFSDIMVSIGQNAFPPTEFMESKAKSGKLALTAVGFGGTYEAPTPSTISIEAPRDINEACNIIKFINSKRPKQNVIIIDEMERIESQDEKIKIAEFLNSISSVQSNSKFILCGIGQSVEDLLGAHRSATRKLETIGLERINHSELWKILSTAADALDVSLNTDFLMRASILSDGFPHYVHLIGESLFWAMFDDENDCISATTDHFRSAVKGALSRTEVEHRTAYQKATEKTKNTKEYEISLWALADKTETRRQLDNIYRDSYLRIMREFYPTEKPMDKTRFNQRLLSLKTQNHGEIIRGFGSGWFSFRETILRGYVRLIAENQDVYLAKDASQ